MKHPLLLLTFLIVSAIFISGCTSTSQNSKSPPLTPVVMQFDWIYNAQFAGFYQAVEQGYYAEEGLAVTLRPSTNIAHTVTAVLEEEAISFGSAESNTLIADAVAGADIKMLGTMFQDSPMGWMYLEDSGIQTFTDLAKKRVGVHADGIRVIRLLLEKEGADLSGFNAFEASYDPKQVLDGTADALQCYYIDEFVKLNQLTNNRGRIFLARDYGYRAYSQVMFTGADTLQKNPETVKKFLAATYRGWQYAFANKEATVDLILKKYSPELDRDYQLQSLAKIEELMVPSEGALFSPMNLQVWVDGQKNLLEAGLIDKTIPIKELFDQSYLP